ncbi:MAG: cellulase family glycosylhydrolase [Lachnospiraceae bacterium]
MENGKWKKMAIIETVIIAVAVIFVVGFIVGRSFGKSKETGASNQVEESTTRETEAVTQEATKISGNDPAQNGTASENKNPNESKESTENKTFEIIEEMKDVDVSFEVTNQWGDDSMHYYGYTVKIENKGNEDAQDWNIIVPVPEDFKVDSGWNANFVVEDGKLYLTPVEFNAKIAAGSTIDSVGFNASSKEEPEFKDITVGKRSADESADKTGESSADSTDKAVKDAESGDKNSTDSKTSDSNPTSSDVLTTYQGKLSVEGTKLVNKDGKQVQLRGVSTHGLAWFPDYVNYESFKSLKETFGANVVRLAMYTAESGGYCSGGDQASLKKLVDDGVKYATDLSMYVIIDWHILSDGNPNTYKDAAKSFFDEVSKKYKDHDNVIYEICNEPNGGTSWADVKKYAEEIIPVIRKNDEDAVILVGTPTWCQDVDQVINNPIKDQENLMYVVHFYAATHKDDIRNRMTKALDAGIPVFISEFSICDASGNGGLDYDSANKWLETINKYGVSYVGWNLSNKNESSSIIKSSCSKTSGYTRDDLSDSGKWLVDTFK